MNWNVLTITNSPGLLQKYYCYKKTISLYTKALFFKKQRILRRKGIRGFQCVDREEAQA